MSAATPSAAAHELAFHEIRQNGRPLVTLRIVATTTGVLVEAEVHPLSEETTMEPLRRPFPFATPIQAGRFVDEVLSSLEHLGCIVV